MTTLHLQLNRPTSVLPSPNVLRVASMFGLGLDEKRNLTIVPPIELTLTPGKIIFVTGPSGGGKSSILRLIADQLRDRTDARVVELVADTPPGLFNRPLVDTFPDRSLEETLALLAVAGLSDAFVLLRTPAELSDGQRYRWRLAQTLASADAMSSTLVVILADEFGATLDRVTAAVLARAVRRWVSRSGNICFIAATTHDDLLEPLEPDVLIEKGLGSEVEVLRREEDELNHRDTEGTEKTGKQMDGKEMAMKESPGGAGG